MTPAADGGEKLLFLVGYFHLSLSVHLKAFLTWRTILIAARIQQEEWSLALEVFGDWTFSWGTPEVDLCHKRECKGG